MNPHAIIVGHTGSGKSVLIKATEIFQTLISTSDDILILDPQNEFKEIADKVCKKPCGSYHDKYPVYTGTRYRSQQGNKKDV